MVAHGDRVFRTILRLPIGRFERLLQTGRKTTVWRQAAPMLASRACRKKRRFRLRTPYKAMAADQEREGEAQAWCHALLADMADEAR